MKPTEEKNQHVQIPKTSIPKPAQFDSLDDVINKVCRYGLKNLSKALTLLAITHCLRDSPSAAITKIQDVKKMYDAILGKDFDRSAIKGTRVWNLYRLYKDGYLSITFNEGYDFANVKRTVTKKKFAQIVQSFSLVPSFSAQLSNEQDFLVFSNAMTQAFIEPFRCTYQAVPPNTIVDNHRDVKYYKALLNHIDPSSKDTKCIALLAIIWAIESKKIQMAEFSLNEDLEDRFMSLSSFFLIKELTPYHLQLSLNDLCKEPFFHQETKPGKKQADKIYALDNALFSIINSKNSQEIKKVLNDTVVGYHRNSNSLKNHWPELMSSMADAMTQLPENTFDRYAKAMSHLYCKGNRKQEGPNKVILLLTLMDMIDFGMIYNEFQPDFKLVEAFQKTWTKYIGKISYDSKETPTPLLAPSFYELGETSFWYLHGDIEKMKGRPTLRKLQQLGITGSFDEELFILLCNRQKRNLLKSVLIKSLG